MQDVSNAVGSIVAAKERKWRYTLPEDPEDVAIIGVGLDGSCIDISNEGYRETMVGTISFYDSGDERLSIIYNAAAPEYGKAGFYSRFESEILKVKEPYPKAEIIGVADGAKDNWKFLGKFTQNHILDFYHASEYIGEVARLMYRNKHKREEWLENSLHKLKHEDGAQHELLKEMKILKKKKFSHSNLSKLNRSITCFNNHLSMMNYRRYQKSNYPVGSGVTEAACKTIVKQRLSSSGMKRKRDIVKCCVQKS